MLYRSCSPPPLISDLNIHTLTFLGKSSQPQKDFGAQVPESDEPQQ